MTLGLSRTDGAARTGSSASPAVLHPYLGERSADFLLFLCAAAFSVVTSDSALAGRSLPPHLLFLDQLTGALACATLFLRRRAPVPLAVLLLVTGSFSHLVTGPSLVAVFTVVAHRPPRVTRWVAVLAAAPLPVFLIRSPHLEPPVATSALTYFALIAAAFGWGLYVRFRRRLIAELRARAEWAEAQARRRAREEIAREMHDVLVHRLSLLSVHAGALEFRPDAPPDEVRRASGVIRESAHRALQDLREIIGMLREPANPYGGGAAAETERPQPTLGELPQLVAESRAAGTAVTLQRRLDGAGAGAGTAPAGCGRTVYRIVQEALTNARKHAPGAPVTVLVEGGPESGLTVEVRNPVPGAGSAQGGRAGAPRTGAPRESAPSGRYGSGIPGDAQGLAGLAERARLTGGRLEHGHAGGEFTLHAWLPWSTHDGTDRPADRP